MFLRIRTVGPILTALTCILVSSAAAQAPADTAQTPEPAEAVEAPAAETAAPEAAKPAGVYYEKARVVVDGKAEANGRIELSFAPQGGKSVSISVNVLKDAKKQDIAKAIHTELSIAAGALYKVKVSGHEIKIERAKKENPTFSVSVDKMELSGVSVLVKKG